MNLKFSSTYMKLEIKKWRNTHNWEMNSRGLRAQHGPRTKKLVNKLTPCVWLLKFRSYDYVKFTFTKS